MKMRTLSATLGAGSTVLTPEGAKCAHAAQAISLGSGRFKGSGLWRGRATNVQCQLLASRMKHC